MLILKGRTASASGAAARLAGMRLVAPAAAIAIAAVPRSRRRPWLMTSGPGCVGIVNLPRWV